MHNIILLLVLLSFSLESFAHGGDDGPTSFEDEFGKLGHFHLPLNFSTTHGLSFTLPGAAHEDVDHHDEHEQTHEEKKSFEVDVHPVAFLSYDKVRRLVNLEVSKENGTGLELASENSPYLLLENKKWDLGLGIEADFHLPLPPLAAGVGISFIKGKNYYSIRMLDNKSEKRQALSLPFSPAKLASWRPGDQLVFATKGSLVLNLLIGIEPFVHLGPEYIYTGVLKVSARLLSEKKLEIEIVKSSSHSYGVEGNAIILGAEASKGKGRSEALKYIFDLNDPESFRAIKYLFAGRLDMVNREMMLSGGRIQYSLKSTNNSQSFSANVGLPFLWTSGRGHGQYVSAGVVEEEHDDHDEDDHDQHEESEHESLKTYSFAEVKERYSRGKFSRHMWENDSLFTTVLKGTEDEGSVVSSSRSWSLSRDKLKAKVFQRKMKKLASSFGIQRLAEIQFPLKKSGYIKVDLVVTLSGNDLIWLSRLNHLKKLKQQSESEVLLLCGGDTRCLKKSRRSLGVKFQELSELARSLGKITSEGNMSRLVKVISKINGKLFSSGPLTKSFFSLRPMVKKQLLLEGEDIKKHTLTL